MFENTKCVCGHNNPVGTVLCESCGRAISENEKPIDMRYEGAARRSQTYSKTILDKVWNFFSSVKVAIYLIVITLIASALGTVFPQEMYIPVPKPANLYYKETYGVLGEIYYRLGFHNLYSSWWYVTLLLMIGISLVICSIDRVVPLYRALKKQTVKKHASFLTRQKISAQIEIHGSKADELLSKLDESLQKRHYKIRKEGHALLAEKNRFSRWGPYVNHIGLIIIIIGVMLRLIPGFYLDGYIWVRDGQTVPVPETKYYVKNVDFKIEYYQKHEFPERLDYLKDDEMIIKNYQTDAILYENKNADLPGAEPELVEVARHSIRVNHPLKYKDILLYQSGNQTNKLSKLNLKLVKSDTKEVVGSFSIDLYDPKPSYTINNDTKVEIVEYFPDFILTEDKTPSTKTNNPENPAFILSVISPETPNGEKRWVFLGKTLGNTNDNIYDYEFSMPELTDITGLTVRKDKGLPVVYLGCFITMVGLVMGFYWQHRRIWIQYQGSTLLIAGHTNKNWYGLRTEIEKILDKSGIKVTKEELDYKGGKKIASVKQ